MTDDPQPNVHAPPELLEALRAIAHEEDRPLQSVIAEALRDYVDRKRGHHPREAVLAHLQASVEQHRDLYRRLAQG